MPASREGAYLVSCISNRNVFIGKRDHKHQIIVLPNSPLKAYHNSVAARGPAMFVIGPSALKVGRLLHWKERLEGLRQAGDWLGAFHAAMELFDGKAKVRKY